MAYSDNKLQDLLNQTIDFFNKTTQHNKSSIPTILNEKLTIQSPIKDTWYSSGGFSLTPTDARHLDGHKGVDMRAPAGTSIYPMAPGVVTKVGTDPKGGNVVVIHHANGLKTYYAHCSTIKVHKGDKVDNNTIIATVGDTGSAKGTFPHLHFQVWQNNQIQDPANYFSVPKYTNLNKTEKFWLSDQAKQEAKTFDITQHINQNKKAHSEKVQDLITRAIQFNKLSKDY